MINIRLFVAKFWNIFLVVFLKYINWKILETTTKNNFESLRSKKFLNENETYWTIKESDNKLKKKFWYWIYMTKDISCLI